MHETVAAWVRRDFRKYPVVKSSNATANKAAAVQGLAACEKYINKEYDVRSLCSSMPRRVRELIASDGDRLHY